MSAVNATATLTCANCATEFNSGQRRGKVQRYCRPACQITAANMRRASTRAGRIQGITYPHAGKTPGQPLSPEAITIPPTVKTPASDSPSRLSVLMEKAHSRGGVNAFEIAEIAKLRGISAWAPLSVIIAKDRAR
jgi:hypothetical protein